MNFDKLFGCTDLGIAVFWVVIAFTREPYTWFSVALGVGAGIVGILGLMHWFVVLGWIHRQARP